MRLLVLAALFAAGALGSSSAGDRNRAMGPVAAVAGLTAKERLGEKATDEQRVDDCKVPKMRRTRARPTACPWDFGS